MNFFRHLYNKVLAYAQHRHAAYYLAGVSFVESSVFPIPPDVMLIPMIIAKPHKTWKYAAITTLASLLGGILGYALGYYAFEWIGEPIIQTFGYEATYAKAVSWFENYGFLTIVLAGFTPIPYKLFTLAAGTAQMALLPFIAGSLVGRGLRFFLVAAIARFLGKKLEPTINKYIETIGWGSLIIVGGAVGIYLFCN